MSDFTMCPNDQCPVRARLAYFPTAIEPVGKGDAAIYDDTKGAPDD